jgi:hypothetical protein
MQISKSLIEKPCKMLNKGSMGYLFNINWDKSIAEVQIIPDALLHV